MAKVEKAPGRLSGYAPVAVVDIGSNSVRMVIYEGLRRIPNPLFNEKILCGLGRGVARTGRMNETAISRAINALRRYRFLAKQCGVKKIYAVATAAARDAENGPEFIEDATIALGAKIRVLSGKSEANLTVMGLTSGIPDAVGLVGDLGGGSLELVQIDRGKKGSGITLPLGGLRLIDESGADLEKAKLFVDEAFEGLKPLENVKGGRFYAVGGTWRALARVHMIEHDYPLHVIHHYQISAEDILHLSEQMMQMDKKEIVEKYKISANRADTLPYGALVINRLIKKTGLSEVVLSAYGVREGLLYSKLSLKQREGDPLLIACRDLAKLRARSPKHARQLCAWTDQIFDENGVGAGFKETREEKRLRHSACLLADIGWRAHPDYRGEQSLNIIANNSFAGIDHPARVFLSLVVYYRYEGYGARTEIPHFSQVTSDRLQEFARIVATAQRLAYVLSGAMPGLLPKIDLTSTDDRLELNVPKKYRDLQGERVDRRLSDLASLFDKAGEVVVDD